MTNVRQPAFQVNNQEPKNVESSRADVAAHIRPLRDPTTNPDGRGKQGGGQQGGRPSESMVDALAYKIANLDQAGIDRAVRNLQRVKKAYQIPTDSPLRTIGTFATPATFQRGSLRRLSFSQPLPGMMKVAPGTSLGIAVSPELRKKLGAFLKSRPKRGFGYIIAAGDMLDDLLQEAYDQSEGQGEEDRWDRYIAAFLEYNRHLGLKTPDALSAAVGQLLFFPELQELADFHEAIAAGMNPLNYPAIESFLQTVGLDESFARKFHWVAPRLPAADSNLTTHGKPFAFTGEGYTAEKPFQEVESDIPVDWATQMASEMHNARTNQDHQYLRTALAAGRYNHVRV